MKATTFDGMVGDADGPHDLPHYSALLSSEVGRVSHDDGCLRDLIACLHSPRLAIRTEQHFIDAWSEVMEEE